MFNSFSGNAISAKARAIYGKRLTTANYHDLLRQRTVNDICGYLKSNTSYSEFLKGIDEKSIHRGQLESLLNRSKTEIYFSLCHYDFSRNKGFYRYVISNAEVSIILKTIMLLNSDSADDIILSLPVFLEDYACFDFKAMSKVRSFKELLTVLENTPYKKALEKFSDENGKIPLSDCEHELKVYYYKNLFNLIDKYYKGKTRDELREIVKIEIELLNISLIYRMKYYFNRTNEEIKASLLPFYFKLNSRSLDSLLEVDSNDAFIERVLSAHYKGFSGEADGDYIEDYTKRLKYSVSKRLMRFSSNAPIAFFSLMSLLQLEIENIFIIIEGVRYGNDPSEIEKLLILEK